MYADISTPSLLRSNGLLSWTTGLAMRCPVFGRESHARAPQLRSYQAEPPAVYGRSGSSAAELQLGEGHAHGGRQQARHGLTSAGAALTVGLAPLPMCTIQHRADRHTAAAAQPTSPGFRIAVSYTASPIARSRRAS